MGNRWGIWLQIWIKPREVMRRILDQPNNVPEIIVLMLLGFFVSTLDQASAKNMADQMSLSDVYIYTVILAAIGAFLYYYVIGSLFRWIGSLLGGQGSSRDVRLAIAYSYIPSIFSLLIWFPSIVIFGKENFTSVTPTIDNSFGLTVTFLVFAVIELIIGIWSIIIFLKCLGEAHKFSAWKALLTTLIPVIIFLLAFFSLFTLF